MRTTMLKQQQVGSREVCPNKPHGTRTVPEYPLALGCEGTVDFNNFQQVAVQPGLLGQAGRLGWADPDPHAGVGHKGTVVSHPGTHVSPVLLKRHVADALAKVGEDVGDLSAAPLSPLKDWVG